VASVQLRVSTRVVCRAAGGDRRRRRRSPAHWSWSRHGG